MTMNAPILTLRNIETYYGPIMAIRGVSLELHPGSIATVLGANGAGKTTILKTISGVLDPLSTATNLLYVGGEYRSGFWGHLDVLGVTTMPYLFCCSTGQPAWPMNVDLVRDARNRGGMVFFAHPLTVPRNQLGTVTGTWPSVGHGRELPIDVALGNRVTPLPVIAVASDSKFQPNFANGTTTPATGITALRV